ncbi:hypothetical protein BC829DRAFT_101473 [Chytridium lagenaria]|nr:hypothetical protein BC829DRAFT_101473 [Chytridium lagenaria]
MQGKVAMCPRVGCKGKMLRDVGGKVGVGGREEFGEKLCVCKECRYPFCFWCKSLWHGSQDCSIPAKDVADTLLRYTLGSELDRRRLAFLYGLNLENLITCAEKKMQEAQEVANANAAKASALLQQLTSSEMTVETTKSKSKHKSKVGEKKAEPCRDCNQTWKGRINRDTSALRDIVMGLQPQDDKLKTIFDEASSVIWVYENGSKCPGCGMGVHRVSGCYRILCSVCDCKFCYGCGAPLEHESPALFDENGYVPLD